MEQLKLDFALQHVELKITERELARRKGEKRYFDGTTCSKGHVSERYTASSKCCQCRKENHKKNYKKNRHNILKRQAEWKRKNKDRIRANGEKYRESNKESIRVKKSEYGKKNYEKIKKKRERYFYENKEKILKKKKEYFIKNRAELREKSSRRHKERMISDPEYRTARMVRSFLRKCLERAGSENGGGVSKRVGYSPSDLVFSISKKFKDGMTWDNHGEWHLDHIKPVKVFLDEGITDPSIINALDNLQPLWAKDNLSKGAKYDKKTA